MAAELRGTIVFLTRTLEISLPISESMLSVFGVRICVHTQMFPMALCSNLARISAFSLSIWRPRCDRSSRLGRGEGEEQEIVKSERGAAMPDALLVFVEQYRRRTPKW